MAPKATQPDLLRLDLALKRDLLSGLSRSQIRSMIIAGCVLVDGLPQKSPSKSISPLSCIKILRDIEPPSASSPSPVGDAVAPEIQIVFEDANFAVLNKPANISAHKGHDDEEVTVVDFLVKKFGESGLSSARGPREAGMVHRLDKNTTGLMVVAKNNMSHHCLTQQIQSKACHRAYLAICYGSFVPPVGSITSYLSRDRKNYRKRFSGQHPSAEGKEAITNYATKRVFCGGRVSLVEFFLLTGRTHQIRAQAVAAGHPIVGDPMYKDQFANRLLTGMDDGLKKRILSSKSRQMLHAHELRFTSPSDGTPLVFKAPLPNDMLSLLEDLSEHS